MHDFTNPAKFFFCNSIFTLKIGNMMATVRSLPSRLVCNGGDIRPRIERHRDVSETCCMSVSREGLFIRMDGPCSSSDADSLFIFVVNCTVSKNE